MSNIITSAVEGIEFDPESIAEEEAPAIDLKTAIRDLDALLAEQDQAPKVIAPKHDPCFLHFSYPDKSNTYYFKCNLLSIVASTNNKEITIEASQSQLLKLFSYWQKSVEPTIKNNGKNHKDRSFTYLLSKRRNAAERLPKVQLIRIYTYIDGVKWDLLLCNEPGRVVEMQYLVERNKPVLKICI